MSQSFGTTASIARIASRGSSSPGAISNGIESAGSVAMRCASSFDRIAAAVGLPFILSTASSHSLEQVAQAMGSAGRWYQLYWPRDRELALQLPVGD